MQEKIIGTHQQCYIRLCKGKIKSIATVCVNCQNMPIHPAVIDQKKGAHEKMYGTFTCTAIKMGGGGTHQWCKSIGELSESTLNELHQDDI